MHDIKTRYAYGAIVVPKNRVVAISTRGYLHYSTPLSTMISAESYIPLTHTSVEPEHHIKTEFVTELGLQHEDLKYLELISKTVISSDDSAIAILARETYLYVFKLNKSLSFKLSSSLYDGVLSLETLDAITKKVMDGEMELNTRSKMMLNHLLSLRHKGTLTA